MPDLAGLDLVRLPGAQSAWLDVGWSLDLPTHAARIRASGERLRDGGPLSGLSRARPCIVRHPGHAARKTKSTQPVFPVSVYLALMSDDAPASASPFAGLDYPNHGGEYVHTPNTAALGRLAIDIRELTGIGGETAIAAATLLDRGRVTDALDMIAAVRKAKTEQAEEKTRRVKP
jgi:hypothetical protein